MSGAKGLAAHWKILIAMGLATSLGIGFRHWFGGPESGAADNEFLKGVLAMSGFAGDLFIRALKMIIVPLIVTSVVSGIAGLHGVKGFGRLGGKTVLFYLASSLAAILVGLTMVNLIQPGLDADGQPNAVIRGAFDESAETSNPEDRAKVEQAVGRKVEDFLDVFKAMLPPNIIRAASDNGQMLGVIVFSILFAVATARLPAREMRTLREFFQAGNDVMIVLTRWVMATAPIGVFGLLLPVIFKTGPELFWNLGRYFFTVVAALGFHMFVTMPLVLRFIGRVSPWSHFSAMGEALMLAFSTASSSGTLPVTMRCVQEHSGVSKRVASFTLPLGATVNMDGTALYECVAVIFVAQVMGIGMGLVQQFTVVAAALLTSIGVAGVPSASLVAILLILKNSGIHGAEAAVVALLGVDRLLDMSRTAVNVFGDSCAAVVIAKSEGETLFENAR